MPRSARMKGEFTTYHIMLRGNEKKEIFHGNEDKERFLRILQKAKEKYNFLLYAYCLMSNHIHMIINDNGNDISLIMKSINVSYVMYFNKKYERVGHLFQDRFRSEIIRDDTYLIELSRYIHNNPVKAGMVDDPLQYRWSSLKQYLLGESVDGFDLADIFKVLGIFSVKEDVAKREYYTYVTKAEDNVKLTTKSSIIEEEEYNTEFISSMDEAKERLKDISVQMELTIDEIKNNKKIRDKVIKELRKNSSLKLREIGELMGGISESRVSKILKQ